MGKSLPKRNWRVVFFCDISPVRGKFKEQLIHRRYVFGRLMAAEAWRVYGAMRSREHLARVELWQGSRMILAKGLDTHP